MNKVRIYLAGTIYSESPDKLWKDHIRSLLNYEVYEFFDPDPQNEPELYMVARDKAEIEKCDIFVAYIQRPSFGTSMEIMYTALLQSKPIFIINPNKNYVNDLWLIAHAHMICTDVLSCANHIRTIRF